MYRGYYARRERLLLLIVILLLVRLLLHIQQIRHDHRDHVNPPTPQAVPTQTVPPASK